MSFFERIAKRKALATCAVTLPDCGFYNFSQGECLYAGDCANKHIIIKEEKMAKKVLTIDRERMLELYKELGDCDTVKKFCETLWPDEFGEEWEDITGKVSFCDARNAEESGCLLDGTRNDYCFAFIKVDIPDDKDDYKISNGRILKRKS